MEGTTLCERLFSKLMKYCSILGYVRYINGMLFLLRTHKCGLQNGQDNLLNEQHIEILERS